MSRKHICLMGAEQMPNVIGVLYDRPDVVIPVVTKSSRRTVESLKAALNYAGCGCIVEEPIEVLPYDYEDCRSVIAKVVDEGATVNWTGGTKVMALAAHEVDAGKRLYVNTEDNEILEEDSRGRSSHPIDSAQLGVNAVVQIAASGNAFESGLTADDIHRMHAPDPSLIQAANAIFDLSSAGQRDLRLLSRKSPVRLSLDKDTVAMLMNAKLIMPAANGCHQLHYETLTRPFHRESAQEANARFLTATYLEVFIWSQLKTRGAFDDLLWHVQVNPHQQGRLSEFDVIVSSENRFLVIDCKTGVNPQQLASIIEETHASTRKVGRIFAKWVLYINKFEDELAGEIGAGGENMLASQKLRAKEFGGMLIFRDQLDHLADVIAAGMVKRVLE